MVAGAELATCDSGGGTAEAEVFGARHLVQIVFVLVIKTVDRLVVTSMEVVLPIVLVLVTGQLVTVV